MTRLIQRLSYDTQQERKRAPALKIKAKYNVKILIAPVYSIRPFQIVMGVLSQLNLIRGAPIVTKCRDIALCPYKQTSLYIRPPSTTLLMLPNSILKCAFVLSSNSLAGPCIISFRTLVSALANCSATGVENSRGVGTEVSTFL